MGRARDNTDEAAQDADDHWAEHGDLSPAEVLAKEDAAAPKTAGEIAGEAYQVIGAIADAAGLFDQPSVIKALNYFSGDLTGEILPFVMPQ